MKGATELHVQSLLEGGTENGATLPDYQAQFEDATAELSEVFLPGSLGDTRRCQAARSQFVHSMHGMSKRRALLKLLVSASTITPLFNGEVVVAQLLRFLQKV